jgi:PAS domain S-box-containing protein
MEAKDRQVIETFVANESEMAERVRAFDWPSTSLGSPSTWPSPLRMALGVCLNSRFPMFVRWGPDLIHFYNDAYIPILGQKHPAALGRPAREIWSEVWPLIEPQINAVMKDGKSSWNERVHLKMNRHGFEEDAWVTWSYSPIPDGLGGVGGVFCACTEETASVRAQAERDMLTEQRRLALNSARLGWWSLNLATSEVVWDERFKKIFGVEQDSLAFDQIMAIIHPEDRDKVRAAVQATLDSPENLPYSVEARVIHPDGTLHWVDSRGEVNRTFGDAGSVVSLVGTVADITQRKQNAEALLERTRLAELNADVGQALTSRTQETGDMLSLCARAMVEHLDAAFARIWTVDENEQVLELQASEGLYTHLDGPHSRVPIGQLKIGRIALERLPHLTNQVIGDPLVADQRWARREGMVAFAGYPLIVEDRLIGVAAIFARKQLNPATLDALASASHAIALGIERKRGEDERARLLHNEQQARQLAESTNRIKDEFLSTLSHELRTPLQAIIGWSHLLNSGQLDQSEVGQALETIERNAHAQVQLVEDLLDVSRIITGKLRLQVQPVDPGEVALAAVEAVRPTAQAKNIRLQLLIDPDAGPVSGDFNRLQQVLWNLLTNAVKFTPKGGRVQVRLERVHSHVEITVSDSGQGISPEFLPHIFDRFRQADQSSTRGHGGLGLGLSIVQQLVELHGGSIQALSPGQQQGSTFVVNLPQMPIYPGEESSAKYAISAKRHPTATPSRATSSHSAESEKFGCPPELQGLRILLVDDEVDSRSVLQIVLESCNATVTTAASSDEALQAFIKEQPDVLISDIGMPGEDGYSLIQKVRAWESTHGGHVPAVALTAYARVEDRIRALRAGFQVHVPKPVEPFELLATVASLTGYLQASK